MELPWLYSFTVLADLLHFGRAAADLHLSQSALSVRIRNLEASLKVRLFERESRNTNKPLMISLSAPNVAETTAPQLIRPPMVTVQDRRIVRVELWIFFEAGQLLFESP
jgi:Bacterial regulatory helix-turn-helix protein, lysR family